MKCNVLVFFILSILLFGCNATYHTQDADFEGYRVDYGVAEDAEVENVLRPYRQKMDEKMNEVLITSTGELRKKKPESTMGNFASDATVAMAEFYTDADVDFAIHNYSGIRISNIGKGGITLGRIYEMMPFDNYLVTVQISGEELQQMCDFMADQGGWPSSKELTFTIENKKAIDVKINGKAINSSQKYTMASNNYVIQSGAYFDFLKNRELNNTNVYVRDALAEYLRSLNENGLKLKVKLDKRVKKK